MKAYDHGFKNHNHQKNWKYVKFLIFFFPILEVFMY